jgi:hypothetical protein
MSDDNFSSDSVAAEEALVISGKPDHGPRRFSAGKFILQQINDNTQPSARVGRKAFRISMRQPGCRNIIRYCGARLFVFKRV